MQTTIVFTEEQQRVVELSNGSHLVLAPPGCGKTELLASRAEKALLQGYKPEEMICLTFTNRAAKGMKERINKKYPDNNIIIGNIHNYCSKFLFENHLIPMNTCLLDEEDSSSIIKDIIAENDYNIKENAVGIANFACRRFQQDNHFPFQLITNPQTRNNRDTIKQIAKSYIKYKSDNNLIDFDDILNMAYLVMRNSQSELMLMNFKWLQVDEVQDLNPLQWEIIKLISQQSELCVFFGDYEQAIYSFMGANFDSLNKIQNELSLEVHYLQKNFRSPSYLLDVYKDYAKSYFSKMFNKIPISERNSAPLPEYMKLHQVQGGLGDEADYLSTSLIPQIHKSGDKTAIIVRFNKSADIFSNSLAKHNISHFKISGVDLFSRKSVKGLLAFLSILNNEFDKVSWSRLFYEFGVIANLKVARKYVKSMLDLGFTPNEFLIKKKHIIELFRFNFSFRKKRIIVFDTETTGLDTANDDIIQIAAIELTNGVQTRSFEVYIKTDKDLTDSVKVHKISAEYLELHGVTHSEGLKQFLEFLGDDFVLIAHNINYDINIIKSNLQRYLQVDLSNRDFDQFDSIKLSRLICNHLHSYKLKDLIEYFSIDGVNSHNAMDDVKATVGLLNVLYEKGNRLVYDQTSFMKQYPRELKSFINKFAPLYSSIVSQLDSDVSFQSLVQEYFSYINIDEEEKIEFSKLMKHIEHYTSDDSMATLRERLKKYVPEYKLFKESDLFIGDEEFVVTTVHKAKGLEFDNVILVEATSNNYPSFNSKTDEEKAEDARIFYVALTRAKKRIHISYHTGFKNNSGANYRRLPSLFIAAIQHHFVQVGQ